MTGNNMPQAVPPAFDLGKEVRNMRETWKLRWQAAAIRAVKTMAQTALGCIGAAAALGNVDWAMVGSAAVMAALVSLLTNVAGLPEVEMQTTNKTSTDQ